MLKSLYIDNYALIDNLKIDFNKGLSIITGETGAGKSILMGALSLILGKRADTTVLQDNSKKCVVEGVFNITDYHLDPFFKENDLEYDNHTIIRREIGANGKSRAFINDTPVTLDILGSLTIKLIDIHSQHENLALNDSIFQLKVIDNYGNHQVLLEDYKNSYHQYRKLLQEYNDIISDAEKNKADFDYFQFQYNQLAEAKLQVNEQEHLELDQEQLTHAVEIKSNLLESSDLIGEDENGLISRFRMLQSNVTRLIKFLPETDMVAQRIDSIYIELKDIYTELENLNNRITDDPDRLEYVNNRLDLIYSLMQKHHVNTVNELLELESNLKMKLTDISNIDFRLEELAKKVAQAKEQLETKAKKITSERTLKFPEIQKKVTGILQDLGIPNATYILQHKILEDFTPHGKDFIQFLFSANKNTQPLEISKIASGGELSRFMLAIKSLISDSMGLPTIIFDEIDTGVSGEIADKVGNIIKNMSRGMQVINITHLPQVASKGDYHYLVYKTEDVQNTRTLIKLLTPDERHLEIAKMLSGKELTEAAKENARELLKN